MNTVPVAVTTARIGPETGRRRYALEFPTNPLADSVTFGVGVGGGPPGAVKVLHLVVRDADAAAAFVDAAGVEHSGLQHFSDGQPATGAHPERRDYQRFIFFEDPDGNGWAIQEVGYALARR